MKKFKKIYIEITNHCNLACQFCHQTKRQKAFMSPAEFEEILRLIAGQTDYLSLHVLGEPLLHPDLGLLLEACHSHGLQVNLSTNGVLLERNRATLLTRPALRQINISLHSLAQPETSQEALDSYLSETFDFIQEAIATTGLFISLRLWNLLSGSTNGEIKRNRLIHRRLETFFNLPFRLPDELTPGHGLTLAPRLFLSQNLRFAWPHESGPDLGKQGYCRGLRDHIAILVDGTVTPCCLDAEADINLGNIHRLPLAGILAGPRASRLRQGFSRQKLVESLCRHCTFRQRFSHVDKNIEIDGIHRKLGSNHAIHSIFQDNCSIK